MLKCDLSIIILIILYNNNLINLNVKTKKNVAHYSKIFIKRLISQL